MRPRQKTSSGIPSILNLGIVMLVLVGVSHSIPKPVPDDKGIEFIFTTPFCRTEAPPTMFIMPQTTTQALNVSLVAIDNNWTMFSSEGAIRMEVPCLEMSWNELSSGAFYLRSSIEVALFLEYADDSHAVFPLDTLGTAYIVSTFHHGGETFLVVTGNGSYVEIKLPDVMQGTVTFNRVTYTSGSTVNFTLGEFEYASVKCDCDLTGAIVTATLPVNVLVGGVSKTFETIEQLHSRNTWGKKFLFSSHPWISSDIRLQIIGQNSDTSVTLIQKDTSSTSQFVDGNILSFNVTVTDFLGIESDAPILCGVLFDIFDTTNTGHRTLNFLIPVLLYHVSSAYVEDRSVSHIAHEVSAGLFVTVNTHPLIQFNDTIGGNPFEKPMTYFWKFFICKDVPLSSPFKLSTSDTNRVPFIAYVFRRSNITAFNYFLSMRITSIYDACTESPRSHGGNGDGIDNDCDNRIDEERLNNADDDGDSRVDEDISYHGKIGPNPADLAYVFFRANKETESGISNSVVSVIVSIVVAFAAVGGFIGIMLLAEKLRSKYGSSRVMPMIHDG